MDCGTWLVANGKENNNEVINEWIYLLPIILLNDLRTMLR